MKLLQVTVRGTYANRFKGSTALELPIADLGDAALVAVTGDNGAGKTTIIEAATTGAIYLRSPSRGQLYEVIREKDGSIEAVWSVNGETFKHRILVDGVSKRTEAYLMDYADVVLAGGKVKDYEAAIARNYPPYITYLASAFGAQGGAGRFLDLAPADRKKLFAKMIGADYLDDRAEIAGTKAREQKLILERARGKVEALRSRTVHSATTEQIAEQREKVERLGRIRLGLEQSVEEERKAVEAWKLKTQELEHRKVDALAKVDAAKGLLATMESGVSSARYHLEQITARLSKKDELVAKAEAAGSDAEAIREKLHALEVAELDYRVELEHYQNESVRKGQEIAIAESEVERAKKAADALEDVPCRGDGKFAGCRLIGEAQKGRAVLGDLVAQLHQARNKEIPAEPQKPDLSREPALKAALQKATEWDGEIAEAREQLAALAEAEKRVEMLKAEIVAGDGNALAQKATVNAAEIEVQEADEQYQGHLKSKPAPLDTDDLKLAKSNEDNAKRQLVEMETAAKEAERVKADLATARAEEKHAAEETDDYTKLQKDLRKIKTLEIDGAGPEVSQICNELLHACYGTRYTVKLITQEAKATKRGGMKETFDLQVIDAERGTESGASMKSGGEKVIISEALSLAIAIYNCRQSTVPMADLFRDECDGALHAGNSDAYLRMLRKAVEVGGFHRVYFVTHREALAEKADARLEFRDGKVVAA